MLDRILYKVGRPVETIGDLIPKYKVTLLHGRSGGGKTVSILKYLSSHGVIPYFIDFDFNDELNGSDKLIHIDGYKLADELENQGDVLSFFKDQVAIIDTYAKADLATDGNVLSLIDSLIDAGSTVIVIAHTTYYSGKPPEPAVDPVFANHVASRLHLHNDVKKSKTEVYLEIEKLRGKDSQIIFDWMRDESGFMNAVI